MKKFTSNMKVSGCLFFTNHNLFIQCQSRPQIRHGTDSDSNPGTSGMQPRIIDSSIMNVLESGATL